MIKIRYNFIVLIISFNFISFFTKAQVGFASQNSIGCGTSEIMKDFFSKNPKYVEINKLIEEKLLLKKITPQKTSNSKNRTQSIVSLPVVVHIIHNNGSENISDSRVLTGIQHLNEAFANIGYYNPADGVDTYIQFCLAQRDPYGNLTNGITRDISTFTNMNGPNYYSDDQNVKNINRWNPSCYINIWLVNDIPGAVAGYAYLPSAAGSNVDGIIEEAQYFGSSNSNEVVAIHEMGHYLGLYHTFEGGCLNSNCMTDGDKVCDTPPDNSTTFLINCNTPINTCSTDSQSGFLTDQNDLTSDYMDYGNFNCMSVFTQGQADRMNWFITNVRSSLLNCKSCLPPCPNPVTANFNSSANNITVGSSVNFTNTSINGVTYKWYINNVLQSSIFNYSNTFNNAGQYMVKLVVDGNNNTLCDSSSKEELINVTCPVNSNFYASSLEIPVGQTISFTNTSTGTPISYSWYINNVLTSTTPSFSNLFSQAGTFTITLIIGSGVCTSTKSITIDVIAPCNPSTNFEKMIALPTMTFAPQQTLIAQDSGIVILGSTVAIYPAPYTEVLTVMKLSKNGNFLWAKNYYNSIRLTPQRIIQLHDGNFLLAGMTAVSGLNYESFVMKIDNNGQIIWKKSFTKTGITNFYFSNDCSILEAPTNEILLSISLELTGIGGDKTYLIKLDANGNLIWNKEVNAMYAIKNLAVKDNSLFGIFESNSGSPNYQTLSYVSKINISNGTLNYAKKYYASITSNINQPQLKFRNLDFFNNQLKLYGSITSGGGINDTGSHIMAIIDTFGLVQNLKRIRFTDPLFFITNDGPSYYRHGTILKNGEYAFLEKGESPYFPYQQKIFLHHADQISTPFSTNLIMNNIRTNFHFSPTLNNNKDNIKDRGNGSMIISVSGQTNIQSNQVIGLIVYNSDYNGLASATCPVTAGPYILLPNTIITADAPEFTLTDAPFSLNSNFNVLDSSIQFNSYNICSATNNISCYSVKINSPDTICIAQDSVLITCHRNTGCTESINWNIIPSAQNGFRQINDTTIKVKYSNYGNYSIVAKLNSCSYINDTANIFIAKNASLLSLGPDKNLCNFSSAILNAGSGYKEYHWNNGSTDSTTTVYNGGEYFVTVKDYCNNSINDTIKFTLINTPNFNLGNDTTICSKDTLTISAPNGFNNYNWASNYNISNTTGQIVRVWPRIDTIYTVTATLDNTCTVLDSIKVSVKMATTINLGNDTSFCQGGSAHFDAGIGFTGYMWNTGAISSNIFASTVGVYSVKAFNTNGCISKDTIQIIAIYPKPIINLGADANLCKNKNLILDAGAGFNNYTWQDSSHNRFFTASNLGQYWVRTTTNNGCISFDTINVINIFDTSSNFINPTIEICINQKTLIKPKKTYNSYLWSTGSNLDYIFVTQTGNYWLQVTNSLGCKSKESFNVSSKQCIKGVFFPNSFTPNNDNINETFKALVYEDLEFFQLDIFNRYGQKIFETFDWNKSWDGTLKGDKQEVGAYVWVCSYKFKSGLSESQKGTVLLLR